jgi:hypothetical protein
VQPGERVPIPPGRLVVHCRLLVWPIGRRHRAEGVLDDRIAVPLRTYS